MDDGDLSIPTNCPSDLNHHATYVLEEPRPQLQLRDQELQQQPAENDQDEAGRGTCVVSSHFSMSSAPLCYFSVNVNEQMLTWLRPSGTNKAEDKLESLRELINSFHSQLEVEKVISAIREASTVDLNKMAGAADFCTILVEIMEMGGTTSIADVFYYCECFVARQQGFQPSTFSASEYWAHAAKQEQNQHQIKFRHDVDRITKDAVLLKRTEMLAGQSLRSKPDHKDSENISKMLLSETNVWRALAISLAGSLYRLRRIYLDRDERKEGNVISASDIRVAHEALAIHAPLVSRMV